MELPQLAAALRAQADDLSLYAGVLLGLVSEAFPPELVEVERERRGLFRRGEPPVTAVTVTLGDRSFRLSRPRVGAPPVAEVRHVVRGVVLSGEVVPLVPWSERLAAELSRTAAQDARVGAALEQLLRPVW